jgi:general secretion pathway protein A
MYLEFFKFRKRPFHITPDPEFLFLSPSHKEASASIIYGIEQRKGFIAITGEVGVGKTTILRSYLEGTDPERIKVVYIFNAAVPFQKLLKQIFLELGIPLGADESPELEILFHYLITEYENDRNVVLIIDEAQNMPVETLEHLRMLSNLETSQDKLLQIVLVGQPEFEAKIDLPELRQLKQRIAIRCRIGSLTPEESRAYIEHRLMRASSFHNPIFTKDALKRIVKESNGIPRIINVLCDNALITAFGYQRKPVNSKIVKEVIVDFKGRGPGRLLRWRTVCAVFLGLVFGVAFFIFNRGGLVPSERAPITTGSVAPAYSAKPVEPMSNVPAPVAPVLEKKADGGEDSISKVVAEPPPSVVLIDNAAESSKTAESTKAEDSPAPVIGIEQSFPQPEKELKESAAREPLANTQKQGPTTKIVKRGDSIFKLLVEAHGRVDPKLVQTFKDLNPHIQNLDRIKAGEEVNLPQLGKALPASN